MGGKYQSTCNYQDFCDYTRRSVYCIPCLYNLECKHLIVIDVSLSIVIFSTLYYMCYVHTVGIQKQHRRSAEETGFPLDTWGFTGCYHQKKGTPYFSVLLHSLFYKTFDWKPNFVKLGLKRITNVIDIIAFYCVK